MSPPRVAIIGAGPAGLAAAALLAGAGCRVDLYDRMPSAARKLLMAGRGGLNLTHSEPFDRFLARYGAAAPHLEAALRDFPPQALRDYAAGLGEATFVGTSGRVFPESLKASPLVRALLARLGAHGAVFHPRHAWQGWTADGTLRFATPDGEASVCADATILALGGASWPRLGADGGFVPLLRAKGIAIADFRPSNMGIRIGWSDHLRDRFAGAPLKRIALAFAGTTVRGEAVITRDGLEGGAVYALSARLRDALASGPVRLCLDLRPDLEAAALAGRLAAASSSLSFANRLRRAAGLAPAAISLLHEGRSADPADGVTDAVKLAPGALAARIKAVPLTVTGTQGLERAISSAGGLAWNELGADYAVTRLPGTFACGEMLDWEAPTGGYLLQACFATGRAAAKGALARLGLA